MISGKGKLQQVGYE